MNITETPLDEVDLLVHTQWEEIELPFVLYIESTSWAHEEMQNSQHHTISYKTPK